MAVWYILPTANPALCSATLALWRQMGYCTAVLTNGPAYNAEIDNADLVFTEPDYRGWGRSLNLLTRAVNSDVYVCGNDDIHPDLHRRAEDIADECLEHWDGSYGVMQPTGDRWMFDEQGRSVSERICYSPWVGADFALRWNGGQGPFWPGYFHYGADEELKTVTERAGLLWQRPDLIHFHDHFTRFGRERPAYMQPVADNYWQHDTALYKERLAAGFPGSAPCNPTKPITSAASLTGCLRPI